MSDLGLIWNNDTFTADLALSGGDLMRDGGLETAIIVSLFTDRRCTVEQLPIGETWRRGYWGDIAPAEEGDETGSLIWLISREKTLQEVATRARDYTLQALQWLIDDGVASRVDVDATISGRDRLDLRIQVHRLGGQPTEYRYSFNWQAQADRR